MEKKEAEAALGILHNIATVVAVIIIIITVVVFAVGLVCHQMKFCSRQ